MKKIYISGAISRRDPEVARKQFAHAEQKLQALGFEVVNPMTLPHSHDKSWESYMKEDIKALMDCDAIYMLKGWSDSRGAKFEHFTSVNLGIKVLDDNDESINNYIKSFSQLADLEICPNCGTNECIESDSWYPCID